MMAGEYSKLPVSGRIIMTSGEVVEYRASVAFELDGRKIIKDAYIRDEGKIIGPFKIEVN